jgi:hypothetical protein
MNAQTKYTHEERERMLAMMTQAKDTFYSMAVHAGMHQFLEFAGFMNAYIKCCQAMHEKGIDFVTEPLQIADYQAAYVGEKLDCIYGPALADEKNRASFLAHLDGTQEL